MFVRMVLFRLLLPALISLLLSIGAAAAAKEYPGFVVHVQDGDSFILRDASGRESTVRMAEIDAPEHGQVFGEEAKRALKRLIERRQVVVLANADDAYGRLIGRVYLDSTDINAAMVSGGFAWANMPYLTDRDFLREESAARQARRGLWSGSRKPVEPWLWRAEARAARDEGVKSRQHGEGEKRMQAKDTAPDGCLIKGNVSASGNRIYHVPGSRSYDETRIDTRAGERWFCTEADAKAAGWRRADRR